MDRMIAYCGLICSECDGYLATQAGDWEAILKLAEKTKEQFGLGDLAPESLLCDGCLSDSGRLCSYCSTCAVRECAIKMGVPNCAHCAQYACGTIEEFFAMAPMARGPLDAIHSQLAA
jgi:hypothetical protein